MRMKPTDSYYDLPLTVRDTLSDDPCDADGHLDFEDDHDGRDAAPYTGDDYLAAALTDAP